MENPRTLADQQNPGRTKAQLKDSCDALNMRKLRIQKKMRALARELRYEAGNDKINPDKLNQYQELNESLRSTKIIEAEFNYTMHML